MPTYELYKCLSLTLKTSTMPFLVSATRSFPSSLLLPALNLKSDVASSMPSSKEVSLREITADALHSNSYFACALEPTGK